jgi:hypothetical protein
MYKYTKPNTIKTADPRALLPNGIANECYVSMRGKGRILAKEQELTRQPGSFQMKLPRQREVIFVRLWCCAEW